MVEMLTFFSGNGWSTNVVKNSIALRIAHSIPTFT